jgi:hypothetical protein
LTVPPETIRIIEDRYNEEVPILRGRGSALIKTGRGHIRINMPLKFATLEDANLELRPLVAQFRTSPFTMIESNTVSMAVLMRRADAAAAEKVQTAREAKEAALEQYKTAHSAAIAKLRTYDDRIREALHRTYADLAEELQESPPSAVKEVLNSLVAYHTEAAYFSPFSRRGNTPSTMALSAIPDFLVDTERIRKDIENADKFYGALMDKSRELAEAAVGASFPYPSVPVALHQMACQTVPGYPELLHVDLEMFYFNTEPFMPVTTFMGGAGTPTGSITDCWAYWDHMQQRLGPDSRGALDHVTTNTGLGILHEETCGMLSLEYPILELERVPKNRERASHQSYSVPPPGGSAVEDDFEHRTESRTLLIGKQDPNMVVENVVVSLENKLAPQPVEGHMYGTLQYMGQMNAKVRITVAVTGDDAAEVDSHLQRLHEVKRSTEEVALKYGKKVRRNVRIAIDHDLVRLFGVRNVLLDRISTETTGVNAVRVVLEFTEYTTGVELRERLVMTATTAKHKIHNTVLSYLADVAGADLHGFGSDEAMKIVAQPWDGPDWAISTLYGGYYGQYGLAEDGILTKSVMIRVLKSMPWIYDRLEVQEHLLDFSSTATEIKGCIRDRLQKLAGEYLEVWSRRVLRVPGLSPNTDIPRSRTDSSGLFEIPVVPTKRMLGLVVDVITTDSSLHREKRRLFLAVEKAQTLFKGLRGQVKDIRDSRAPAALYPDLDLPDYATAYRRLWAAIKVKTGRDVANIDDLNEAALTPKVKAIVRRVVPTYSDLGVRVPVGRHRDDFARKLTDLVDPDFCFFWQRVKTSDALRDALGKGMDEATSLTSRKHVVDLHKSDDVVSTRRARTKLDLLSRIQPGSAKPLNTTKYSTDPSPIETYIRGLVSGTISPGSTTVYPARAMRDVGVGERFRYRSSHKDLDEDLKDINPYDADHRRRLFQAAVDSVPDRFRRIITAFPTFRVELVETDNEEWTLWDDFYGYNSIKSIHIHNHKYTPAIAELELVNATGNLDEQRSLSTDQEREAREERDRSGPGKREKTTNELEKLDHFYLDAGTPITIRTGYSSKIEELEVRFVGQVVSLTAGDVVKLTAQCYSSELTMPVNAVVGGRNWLAIVDRIMKESPTLHYGEAYGALIKADRRGLRNAFSGEVQHDDSFTVAHRTDAADWMPEEWLATSSDKLHGVPQSVLTKMWTAATTEVKRQATDPVGLAGLMTAWRRWLGDILSNRKTTNVFLPLERDTRGALSEGSGAEWGIPNVTGLEALHELTRYLPGYVCATRPYQTNGGGQRVTLFFGRPEQPYTYTALHLDEEEEWRQSHRQAMIAAERKIDELLIGFFESWLGTSFQGMVYLRKGATVGKVASALMGETLRQAGKTPGRVLGVFANLVLSPWDFADSVENWGADGVRENRYRAAYSKPRTKELRTIESKIGSNGLRTVAGLFFTRYNNRITKGGMITAEWIRKVSAFLERQGKKIAEELTLDWYDRFGMLGEDLSGGPKLNPIEPAGMLLYNYKNWREALWAISAADTANRDDVNTMAHKAFEELADEERVISTLDNRAMSRERFNSMTRSVIDWSTVWKDFLHHFNLYLQQNTDQDLLNSVYETGRSLDVLALGPRMKRFRNHHLTDSAIDIVKNGIQVSQEFMANRVIVSYADGQEFKPIGEDEDNPDLVIHERPSEPKTFELGYDDDIQPSDQRVRVVTEQNAVNAAQARWCAKANLAEALRPMYRGRLLLRGFEKIWPSDVCWINDTYNDVYGPVEVESVVDHLDASGYHVSVVPHAMVINESGSEYADTGAMSSWWWYLSQFTGGANLVLQPILDYETKKKTGKSLTEHTYERAERWVVGQGIFGGKDSGVRLVPLLRRGTPWLSGMRGIGSEGWKVRLEKKWEDIRAGLDVLRKSWGV